MSCICSPGTNNVQHGSFISLTSCSNLIFPARDFANCEHYNKSNYPCFSSMKSTRELESREQTAFSTGSFCLSLQKRPHVLKLAKRKTIV